MVCELIESIPAGKDYFVTLRFNSNENISFVAYSTFIKTNSSKRIVSIGPLRSDGDFVIAAQLSDKNYGSLVSSIFTNQKTIIYSEKNILFKSISEKAPLFIASIIFVLTSMSGAFINIRKLYEGK